MEDADGAFPADEATRVSVGAIGDATVVGQTADGLVHVVEAEDDRGLAKPRVPRGAHGLDRLDQNLHFGNSTARCPRRTGPDDSYPASVVLHPRVHR